MKVTIFSTTNCPSCAMVKKFLSNKGVQYSEINVEENPSKRQEAFKLSGALTVPVTLIERDKSQEVVVGFNLSKLAPAVS